jgi:hypothetical protein
MDLRLSLLQDSPAGDVRDNRPQQPRAATRKALHAVLQVQHLPTAVPLGYCMRQLGCMLEQRKLQVGILHTQKSPRIVWRSRCTSPLALMAHETPCSPAAAAANSAARFASTEAAVGPAAPALCGEMDVMECEVASRGTAPTAPAADLCG